MSERLVLHEFNKDGEKGMQVSDLCVPTREFLMGRSKTKKVYLLYKIITFSFTGFKS